MRKFLANLSKFEFVKSALFSNVDSLGQGNFESVNSLSELYCLSFVSSRTVLSSLQCSLQALHLTHQQRLLLLQHLPGFQILSTSSGQDGSRRDFNLICELVMVKGKSNLEYMYCDLHER